MVASALRRRLLSMLVAAAMLSSCSGEQHLTADASADSHTETAHSDLDTARAVSTLAELTASAEPVLLDDCPFDPLGVLLQAAVADIAGPDVISGLRTDFESSIAPADEANGVHSIIYCSRFTDEKSGFGFDAAVAPDDFDGYLDTLNDYEDELIFERLAVVDHRGGQFIPHCVRYFEDASENWCAVSWTDQEVVSAGEPITIDLNSPAAPSPTNGADVILGTPQADIVDALGGNDTLCLGPGKDIATGGAGNDVMFGEGGDDILRGNEGRDIVEGGAGNDRLLGGIDDDVLRGGDGDDFIGGFGGSDQIQGDDRIFGGFGGDIISGGDGEDRISGLVGNDIITGGNGNDTLNGNSGQDRINGDSGNDIITGGNAGDDLTGGAGNDRISGGKGDDILRGGIGLDDVCIGNDQNNADTADHTCETVQGVP